MWVVIKDPILSARNSQLAPHYATTPKSRVWVPPHTTRPLLVQNDNCHGQGPECFLHSGHPTRHVMHTALSPCALTTVGPHCGPNGPPLCHLDGAPKLEIQTIDSATSKHDPTLHTPNQLHLPHAWNHLPSFQTSTTPYPGGRGLTGVTFAGECPFFKQVPRVSLSNHLVLAPRQPAIDLLCTSGQAPLSFVLHLVSHVLVAKKSGSRSICL